MSAILPEVNAGPMFLNFKPLNVEDLYFVSFLSFLPFLFIAKVGLKETTPIRSITSLIFLIELVFQITKLIHSPKH